MDLLDLVHILAFPSDSIIIEHVAVRQASQLRAWELCISTEIKPMNRNTNDVKGVQYEQSACHSRNWQRPQRKECHSEVQSKMQNKEIMWRRLRQKSFLLPPIWFSATILPWISQITILPFGPHNNYKEVKHGSKLYEVDRSRNLNDMIFTG